MYKFTGFTEKANRALNSAIEIAENLGHTYIGSEHLLLGLLESADSVAGKLLLYPTVSRSWKLYFEGAEREGTIIPEL